MANWFVEKQHVAWRDRDGAHTGTVDIPRGDFSRVLPDDKERGVWVDNFDLRRLPAELDPKVVTV